MNIMILTGDLRHLIDERIGIDAVVQVAVAVGKVGTRLQLRHSNSLGLALVKRSKVHGVVTDRSNTLVLVCETQKYLLVSNLLDDGCCNGTLVD